MPRAPAPDAGLRGPARTSFPASPKQQARALALVTTADVLVQAKHDDGAGGSSFSWTAVLEDVPARIDPIGSSSAASDLVGGQVNEQTSHIISLPDNTPITLSSRIDIEGDRWDVLALHRVTDEIIIRAEVRVV